MTQEEFEGLTGCKVTGEDFEAFNTLYECVQGTPEYFCREVREICQPNSLYIAPTGLLRLLAMSVRNLNAEIEVSKKAAEKAAHRLVFKNVEIQDEELHAVAVSLIGNRATILKEVEEGGPLYADARDYILENLG